MIETQKDVLRIIAFHDVFGFPITAEEVFAIVSARKANRVSKHEHRLASGDVGERVDGWSGKQRQRSLLSTFLELEQMVESGILETEEVFYCLRGRKEIIQQRKMRYSESLRKMLKSQKWIRLLLRLPFVANVLYAGSVAMENAKRDSDIDLVIVSKKGRVWSARFFVNTMLALASMRVYGRHWVGKTIFRYVLRLFGLEKNTITINCSRGRNTLCTAFFIDETIDPKTVLSDDPQFQFWVDRWVSMRVKSVRLTKMKGLFEFVISIIPERLIRWVQERVLMPRNLRERAEKHNGDVVLNDWMIKLHFVDRRREHERSYAHRLRVMRIDNEWE